MTTSLPLADFLGQFRSQAASIWFEPYEPHPPDRIESAAKAAARLAGRNLLAPMTRSPWETVPGDRSMVWRLSGEPALVVKVCATQDPGTARMWKRLAEISARLEPPADLGVPRVRLSGNQPVPWCVIDAAAGSPALLTSTTATELFNVVLTIQQTKLEGLRFRSAWGAGTYVRQVAEPIRQLVAAEVIGEEAGRRALSLLEKHRANLRELRPVTAHNDLALYHVYTGGAVTWVIDWESAIKDRLHMLDVAHLIVNHGVARPDWARELASIAIAHGRAEVGIDLTSNLIVSQLERAAGKALDQLRRRHQQSSQAVEALWAVLEERFLPE